MRSVERGDWFDREIHARPGRRDRQAAGLRPRERTRPARGLGDKRLRANDIVGDEFTRGCQPDPPGSADHEESPELRLELSDVLGDGGLADHELLGCRGERPHAREGREGPQTCLELHR